MIDPIKEDIQILFQVEHCGCQLAKSMSVEVILLASSLCSLHIDSITGLYSIIEDFPSISSSHYSRARKGPFDHDSVTFRPAIEPFKWMDAMPRADVRI